MAWNTKDYSTGRDENTRNDDRTIYAPTFPTNDWGRH